MSFSVQMASLVIFFLFHRFASAFFQPARFLPRYKSDLRTASAAKGLPDFLSLWSGTGAGELWQGSAGRLIESLFAD